MNDVELVGEPSGLTTPSPVLTNTHRAFQVSASVRKSLGMSLKMRRHALWYGAIQGRER